MVKAPTGNENIGKSTGEADFMFDFIASKNINDNNDLEHARSVPHDKSCGTI